MTTTTVIQGAEALHARIGEHLATSDWFTLRYEDIVAFADATGDHQWIHVDRERAARESPFGTVIAHGYYTLSRVGGSFGDLVQVEGFAMIVNYGLERVRFPAPLREGARYRMSIELLAVEEVPNGVQARYRVTTEVEGESKPAMVAEPLFRYYR